MASIISSRNICDFDEIFVVEIGYKYFKIGFKTHPWGFRLMLLWWHVCWHRKSLERQPYSKQHTQPKICPIAQMACLHFNGDNCDLKLECAYDTTGKLRASA